MKMKYLSCSLKYVTFLILMISFLSCSSSEEEEAKMHQTILQSLKDNQSKFNIKLNGDDFYKQESIFNGHLEILEKTFTISYFDQFESNVMIHFGGNKWYAGRPIKIPVKLESGYSSNVMIGRMKDKEKRLGEGYLMAEGFLTFKCFTKEKIIMTLEGKAKKYPKVDAASPSFDVKGTIVIKNPKINFLSVDEKAAFYEKY